MDVGHIECHQHGIKVKSAHRFKQDGRVMMPGQAQKSNASFFTRLDKRLECTRHGRRSSSGRWKFADRAVAISRDGRCAAA